MQAKSISPAFLNLLKEVTRHVDAVIEEAKKEEFVVETTVYKICRAFGGYFIPISQGDDPLMGKIWGKSGWEDNPGQCDGLVKQSADEIAKTGIANPYPVVEENTRHYQETQGSKIPHHIMNMHEITISGDKKGGVLKFIHQVVDKLNTNYVYKIGIMGNLGRTGHATRIRKIPRTDIIEFYEPNWGTFYFNNSENFCVFYALLMNHYRFRNLNFPYLFLIKLEKQIQENNTFTTLKFLAKQNEDEMLNYVRQVLDVISYLINIEYLEIKKAPMVVHEIIMTLLPYIKNLDSLKTIIDESDIMREIKKSEELKNIYHAISEKKKEKADNNPKDHTEMELASVAQDNAKTAVASLEIGSPIVLKTHVVAEGSIDSGKSLIDITKDALQNLRDLNETFKGISRTSASRITQSQLEIIQKRLDTGAVLLEQKHANINSIRMYLAQLGELLHKISTEISGEQSKSTVDLFKTCLTIALQQITFLKGQFNQLNEFHNPRLDEMDNSKRITADKEKLQEIIHAMKTSLRYSEKLAKFSAVIKSKASVNVFPNLLLPQKLQEICDKEYSTYTELENDVHQVNKSAINYKGMSEFTNLLDDFFKTHLGYEHYSRDKERFKCFEVNASPSNT
jgi:hypothetical protein